MLVPKINTLNKQNSEEKEHILELDTIDIRADFYNLAIHSDEKKRLKFIKYIEKIIRTSFEYRSYIGFLKKELNLTKCTFLPMIDTDEIKKVGLEFHHYPYTLFDIVSIVLDEYMLVKKEICINPFKIAEEIMMLHYQNHIGLVPLTTTVHELAHSGKVFINLKYVFGNYNKFINQYSNALSDNYKQLLSNLEQLSEKEENGEEIIHGDILDKDFLRVSIEDVEKVKKIETEEEMLA